MWRRIYPVTAPDIAPYQAEARPARGVHRNHRMYQHTVRVALPNRAESAAALRGGWELHLGSILMARTCRPAQASPVRSDQPSISFATVTFGLAKNRPARSSPPRLPPRRRKHTVLSMAICSRIAPPFIEAQISECPERHFHGGPVRRLPQDSKWSRRRVGQAESQGRSEIDITCVHVLAVTPGDAGSVDRPHFQHPGVAALQVDRSMAVQALPPAGLCRRDRRVLRRPAPSWPTACVGCPASANNTLHRRPDGSAGPHKRG